MGWSSGATPGTESFATVGIGTESFATVGIGTESFATVGIGTEAFSNGSPTTLGLQAIALKSYDVGDGSVRFVYSVNDNAPIYLDDGNPVHIVDSARLP